MTLTSMGKADQYLYNQLVDYLALRFDFFVNLKQFMNWAFLSSVFDLLRNAANKFHTGLDRMLGGYQLLGMRLSEYNLEKSITRFDE